MIDAFLQYLQYEKNFSSHTFLSYRNDLISFRDYIIEKEKTFDVDKIDSTLVRGWVLFLLDTGHSSRTVNRKLSALKSFYRFLNLKGLCSHNPTKRIVSPKTKKPLPSFFKEKEMAMAIDSFAQDDFKSETSRLIIDVFYQTGIRRAELINLKDTDVDFSNHSISVIGKRNKQRIIPIGQGLQDSIKDYIALRDKHVAREVPFLFVTNKGKQLYPKYVYLLVHSAMRSVSTLEKCSPHVLRHTFATILLNHDADIDVVKTALGHANLSATEVYTHTTFEQLQSIYKHAHPRAIKK